ncbi:hypothetical protein IGL98_003204 [Enterococcus sp. DIV0840]|uniref:isoprenylcysteine carboxylmethyltransferase family protein n=1 Tax=Enterococcus TaxID=1350 RepID=UPI001A8FCB4A|nr:MULTISPECIES: isoprenylcysteine carboxylmethyltransferase family protein [Enterococcus]MBO0435887.1 hypothetical protein [Enterococcus sp. DIV0849a]MBO0472246.1 hypothetical protein [Enterococcus ureasiticus]
MSGKLYVVFILLVLFRLLALYISKENEKKLLASGAVEYGKTTSKYLAILHTMIYFSSFFEGIITHVKSDMLSFVGIIMMMISYSVLLFVIKTLNRYWTVKLIFEENHKINSTWIFKKIKHPNYFFNIIPELIGITFIFHAWVTFAIGCIPYGVCLYLRIRQENSLLTRYNGS